MTTWVFFALEAYPLPIAAHLVAEGQEVIVGMLSSANRLMIKGIRDTSTTAETKRRLSVYDGLLVKHTADEVMKMLWKVPPKERDDYFIFFDYNNTYNLADQVRKMGFKNGLFPTEWYYRMEKERALAKSFVEKNYPDIKVADAHDFKTVKDGIAFLEAAEDKIYVLKSNGNSAGTVVPKTDDAEEARELLVDALNKQKQGYEAGGFLLEEKIPNCLEVTPVMVFYDGEPVYSLVEFECKGFGAGDIGVQKGGNLALSVKTPFDCELNRRSFPPAVYALAKKQPGLAIYDIGLLYNGEDFYFTEYCFDADTEMLTKSGWKKYYELGNDEYALALEPHTKLMAWKRVIKKVAFEYDGPMIQLKNGTSFDALVTPEHRFWVRADSGKMKLKRADELTSGEDIPRTGVWIGDDAEDITLPPIVVSVPARTVNKGVFVKTGGKTVTGKNGRTMQYVTRISQVKEFVRHTLPEMTLNTEALSYLIGIWLAEGSFGGYYEGEPRTLNVAQMRYNKKHPGITVWFDKLGIQYSVSPAGNFVFNNRRLAIYFWNELGLRGTHAETKFIPEKFKNMSVRHLQALLDGYMTGDGCFNKNQWMAATTSKQLADDLQEVIHKVGMIGNIKFNPQKGTKFTINGKEFTRRHDSYLISTRSEKIGFQVKTSNKKVVPYKGVVWDVEVEDFHTLFVRRNGRAFFSSNCAMRYGWDGFFSECVMRDDGKPFVAAYFEDVMAGNDPLVNTYGASVRLFNLGGNAATEDSGNTGSVAGDDIPVTWDDEVSNNLFLYMIKEKKDEIVTVGGFDFLGVATGASEVLETAVSKAYAVVDAVTCETLYYRPQFDYLSMAYKSSILNRLAAIKPFLDEVTEDED